MTELDKANRLCESHNFEDAIVCFSNHISVNPGDFDAYEGRGLAEFEIGNHEKAIFDLDRSISINPENNNAIFIKAKIYQSLSNYELAKKSFERALSLSPDNIEYKSEYIFCCLENGENDLAEELSNELLKEIPDDLYALTCLADISLTKNKFNEAIMLNKKILTISSGYVYSYNNIGYSLSKMELYRESIPYFNTAIRIDDKFAYSYSNRGYSLAMLKEYRLGIKDLEHSIELDPGNSYAYKNFGKIMKLMNDLEKAKYYFVKAQELRYSDHYDDEVDNLLSELE